MARGLPEVDVAQVPRTGGPYLLFCHSPSPLRNPHFLSRGGFFHTRARRLIKELGRHQFPCHVRGVEEVVSPLEVDVLPVVLNHVAHERALGAGVQVDM